MVRKLGRLELTFSGEDPGIAMDLRATKLRAGAYVVVFDLSTAWRGQGDVFFTIDGKTLPKGGRLAFEVLGKDQQRVRLELKTDKVLKQLRIDVTDAAGAAVIENLR